jgi:S-(hydroxymethyl)glutathione dehydrogenase/alcohol dehydrogenase
MKAAVLTALGRPLELLDGIEPPALRSGQLLVKVAYSGLCRSQVMEARGARGEDPWLPHMLGHEGSGRVLAVGEGVAKVHPGDLVVLGWIRGRGLDAGGSRFTRGAEVINAGGVTTLGELAVVSENRVTPLPAGVPLDAAVLFGCALPTGAGLVLHEIAPRPGAAIAFFGLGGVGASALLASALQDYALRIAVEVTDEKLALAADLGADVVVDARSSDPLETIRRHTGGHGVDYAIEASGRVEVIEQAFEAVRTRGGLAVFASHPPADQRIRLDPHALISGKQIRGSWGGASDPDRDVPRLAALYRDGRLPLERIMSRPYRLEEINQALDDLEAGVAARPIIEIDPHV